MTRSLAAWPGPMAMGVSASRTGIVKIDARCVFGSRIGI